jgi:hypothetical protein
MIRCVITADVEEHVDTVVFSNPDPPLVRTILPNKDNFSLKLLLQYTIIIIIIIIIIYS